MKAAWAKKGLHMTPTEESFARMGWDCAVTVCKERAEKAEAERDALKAEMLDIARKHNDIFQSYAWEQAERRRIDEEAYAYSEQVEELKAELTQSKAAFEGLKSDYDIIRRRLTNHAKFAEKMQGFRLLAQDAANLISRCDPECIDWLERANEMLEK